MNMFKFFVKIQKPEYEFRRKSNKLNNHLHANLQKRENNRVFEVPILTTWSRLLLMEFYFYL
jgi:hypothetical protein